MKKYKIILKEEEVFFEKEEKKAKQYASYLEFSNGFVCNEGNFININEYYFNTLKEVKKFIEENKIETIFINKNGLSDNVAKAYLILKLNEYDDYIDFDIIYNDFEKEK